jgi:hypothetical protein
MNVTGITFISLWALPSAGKTLIKKVGGKCVNTPRPGASSPSFDAQQTAPVEWSVPPGQTCLDVKETYNQGRKNSRYQSSGYVQQELDHGFILLPENSPHKLYTADHRQGQGQAIIHHAFQETRNRREHSSLSAYHAVKDVVWQFYHNLLFSHLKQRFSLLSVVDYGERKQDFRFPQKRSPARLLELYGTL